MLWTGHSRPSRKVFTQARVSGGLPVPTQRGRLPPPPPPPRSSLHQRQGEAGRPRSARGPSPRGAGRAPDPHHVDSRGAVSAEGLHRARPRPSGPPALSRRRPAAPRRPGWPPPDANLGSRGYRNRRVAHPAPGHLPFWNLPSLRPRSRKARRPAVRPTPPLLHHCPGPHHSPSLPP